MADSRDVLAVESGEDHLDTAIPVDVGGHGLLKVSGAEFVGPVARPRRPDL